MRIKETKVYSFTELSDSAKQKARQWWRELQDGDTFWSESVIEDAETIAEMLGFIRPKIYWSGFSSQGDGACVVGTWRAIDCKHGKVTEHAPQDKTLAEIDAQLTAFCTDFPNAFAESELRGRGCADHDVTIDARLDTDAELDGDDTQQAKDELRGILRDFMRWIYRSLEREYEYVNSDEQVDESILANEYEFEKDGRPA